MMLVTNAVVGRADRFNRKLAIGSRDRDQLASREFLGSAAFVGINMSRLRADYGVEGTRERGEAEYIRGRTVEHEKYLDIGSKMFFELLYRRLGMGVIAIAHDMAMIGV